MKLRNARYLSHDFIDSLLQEGDIAVDATAGNGHDTLYLAQKVGERGHVYAFDVQQAALDSTKERLAENGIPDERVTLILSGHERMADYVKEPVRCVLFNLGWLPSGDHSVTTRVPTTLAAVEAACGLLLPGGMVSVCVYPGHEEGTRELRALEEALAGLDIREYNVLHGNFVNQRENAPQTFLIQREESLRDC